MKSINKIFFICSVLFLAAINSSLRAAEPSAIKPTHQSASNAWEPVVLGPRQGGVILLPDGKLLRFTTKGLGDNRFKNFTVTSSDGGATWSEPKFAYEGPPASLPLLDADGELHVFPMLARLEDPAARKKIGINYVQIRSTAKEIDVAGLLIESAAIKIDPKFPNP